MASGMYNTGKESLVDGTIVWGTSDMRVLLVTSGYTFDPDHDFVADLTPGSNEISVAGYSRQVLGGEVVVVDDANNRVEFDATDVVFSGLAAGQTIAAAVVYLHTGSDATAQLLAYIDLADTPTNGGDVTIQWDPEGIFYF